MDTLLGLFFVLALLRALFAPTLDELGYRREQRWLARKAGH
jgi:hypothetical protein